MAPSAGNKTLDEILVSDLVDRSPSPNLKHKLMQLSLYSYLEKAQKVEWVEVEHQLEYIGPEKLAKANPQNGQKYRRHKRHKHKENKNYQTNQVSTWPVDLAIRYRDGNKKVCELIEVETINLMEYWERLGSIKFKVKKVAKISKNKHLNLILNDADEVRFSLALNASGLDDKTTDLLTSKFIKRLGKIERKDGVRPFRLYILRGNIYQYCPLELNEEILDSLEGTYLDDKVISGDKWLPSFKSVMLQSYRNIRNSSTQQLASLYSVKTLKLEPEAPVQP